MNRNGNFIDEVSNYISALPIACRKCGGMVPAQFLFLHYRQSHPGITTNKSFVIVIDSKK